MREIRFRGKRLDNGKWTYGYLIEKYSRVDSEIRYAIDCCWSFDNNEWDSLDVHEVIPETIGQYTGLADKNGTEIYDGDLLTDMVGDVFEVFYNTAHCAYMAKYVRTKHAEKKRGHFRLGDQCSLTIEVIGNIYENPELLK